MAERELLVRIIGDDRDLQRALGNTEKRVASVDNRMASFGKNATRAFGAAGIALGTATVFQGLQASVDAASDLNEQMARSEQVFEENAASVQDWSETLATSFGIAQDKGLEFAGTFGLLFRNLGVSGGEAEQFSKQLVELAADLASFNNTDVETALNALRSGLTGEIEPLRRFGVFLSEARTQQEALATTGKTSADSLTTQEKVLTRFNIILEDTTRAQGDFGRTSEGLANQQRKLQAQLRNLSASFGSVLIPKVLETVGAVNDLVGGFQRLQRSLPSGAQGQTSDFFGELFKSLPAQIADQAERLQQMGKDIEFVLEHGPFQARGLGFEEIGKVISDDIDAMAREIEGSVGVAAEIAGNIDEIIEKVTKPLEAAGKKLAKAQAKASRRDAERAAKEFNEFLLGMGLKLDNARLTEGLDNDLAVLRELERAILRRIKTEGRTFELVQELTDTRLQIASLGRQQAADAASAADDVAEAAEKATEAGREAFESTIDALDLKLEMAQVTKSFADDQKVLRAIEKAILDRIKVEGETTDLLRQLFNVRQQQAEVARQVREQAQKNRQGDIFERLGLTREGDERVPGGGSLRRRAKSLLQQIEGTALDTKKNRQILNGIINTSNKDFREAGRSVRQAALNMLNDIESAFDDKKETGGGEITKGGIRSTQRLLRGLDLTEEERRIIQQRNLGVTGRRGLSAFGVGLVPSTGTAGSIDRGLQQTETFIIQNLNVVSNDPNDMMKKLQKKARRSSGGRRGRHGGANLGMQ